MRREFQDELLRNLFAFNTALRAEISDIRRLLAARKTEAKYNPNWRQQPRAPRGAAEGGQWVEGGGAKPATQKVRGSNNNRRPPRDHNSPPGTLQEIFPMLLRAPASAILAPIDSLLGISGPGMEANRQATQNLRDGLIREMRALDPNYRFQTLDPGGLPNTVEGRNNMLNGLRAERAALIYRVSGDIRPLQVETLRYVQGRVDAAYRDGVRLYESGALNVHLGRNEAIGNHIDSIVRRDLRDFYASLDISTVRGQPVQVNRRAYNSPESSYTVPDARVGNVVFDFTLTRKMPGSAQVSGFFRSDFRPFAVVIVRPSQIGRGSTYLITAPPMSGGSR